jgi:Zn finger protein HypA/HybF involved in hydrogenase expression
MLDEFEAFRLVDYNGLSHAEAADEMEISRSTFTRLIEKTRRKIADFLIHGKVLTISGGNIHFRRNIISCKSCGHKFNTSFNSLTTECPICHSKNIINLAGGFGHGKCCALEIDNK